jgi:hypothetical protein
MRTFPLEESLFVPMLWSAAPGAVRHWILNAAAAPPIAAGILSEPSGRLERLIAGKAFLVNVGPAPGAEGERL